MGKGHWAQSGVEQDRLGVAGLARTRRGIAVVADRELTGQALEDLGGEHLAHQTHVLVQAHLRGAAGFRVKDGDPRRFLTAVLKGVETEVGEVGHRLIAGQDRKHAAGLFGLVGPIHHDIEAGGGVSHGASQLQISFNIVHQGSPQAVGGRSTPMRRGIACSKRSRIWAMGVVSTLVPAWVIDSSLSSSTTPRHWAGMPLASRASCQATV